MGDTRRVPVKHIAGGMIGYNYMDYTSKLAFAVNELKYWCACPCMLAYYCMGNTLDLLRKSPIYRHKVKQLFKQAEAVRDIWMYCLAHPDPIRQIRLFRMSDLSYEWRQRYRDGVTDEDYIIFWSGQGAHAYQRLTPLINAMQWKLRRHMDAHNVKYGDVIASAMLTDILLGSATTVYNMQSAYLNTQMPPTSQTIQSMCSTLSMQRLATAWHKAVDSMNVPEFTKRELDDITLTINQIDEKISDGVFVCEVTMANIKDYGTEIFRTKKVVNELLKECREKLKLNKEYNKELQLMKLRNNGKE